MLRLALQLLRWTLVRPLHSHSTYTQQPGALQVPPCRPAQGKPFCLEQTVYHQSLSKMQIHLWRCQSWLEGAALPGT